MSEQWLNKFITNLMSAPEAPMDWPSLHNNESHCGHWIIYEKQNQLFKQAKLRQLNKTHNAAHGIALNLFAQYNSGHIELARSGLDELKTAFDKMN